MSSIKIDYYVKRHFSPRLNRAVLVEQNPGKERRIAVWDLELKRELKTRTLKRVKDDNFKVHWSADESKVAIVHTYEILFFDLDNGQWSQISTLNSADPVLAITGGWVNNQSFYYYQPCICTCIFGGEWKRVYFPYAAD